MPTPQPLFQFSIRSLLVWMAFTAVYLAAFFTPSNGCVVLATIATCSWVSWHLVMAFARDGAARVASVAALVFTIVLLMGLDDTFKDFGIDTREAIYLVTRDYHLQDRGTPSRDQLIQRGLIAYRSTQQAVPVLVSAIAAYICRAAYVARERRDAD